MQQMTITEQNDNDVTISPEALEVANYYITCLDIKTTAKVLDITQERVTHYLNIKEVKRYVDTIFLDQGYLNKYKLQSLLDSVIEKKLEEMEESELYSDKDILDMIKLAHDMRMKEIAAMQKNEEAIGKQINIQQNNYGDSNYGDLLNRIMGGDSNV